MTKVSIPATNDFCPQALFLYGTYKEDGTPNFGLFCWISYCWDGELCIMACIGGEKLTKDRIRASGIFSANLVTEKLLPVADYLGNTEGYNPQKMNIALNTEPGKVLHVPTLSDSPVNFELEVKRTIPLDDGDIFQCRIRNVLWEEGLGDERPFEERLRLVAPVITTGETYFSVGTPLGHWGQWKEQP